MTNLNRNEYHSFQNDGKTAKVFLTNEGFEVDFYEGKELLKTEQHYGKSEAWAEDVADNYVMGIKLLTE